MNLVSDSYIKGRRLKSSRSSKVYLFILHCTFDMNTYSASAQSELTKLLNFPAFSTISNEEPITNSLMHDSLQNFHVSASMQIA